MASRTLLALALSLCSAVLVLPSPSAIAQTPLTKATVQKLRKQVELFVQQQKRLAKVSDVMTPGDAIKTGRLAMAELRFNDRSVARVGEQALFQFEPSTRNFDLKRGTVLLFITPGQGQTRVRTPNAAAGIRGSALFVRYIEDSQVTMVGALTNSDIEISSNDGTKVVLKAGQLGYVYKDRIGVYNFDQKRFQETSPLYKDVDWSMAPAEVKEEIEVALKAQEPIAGKFENTPTWTMLAENRATRDASVSAIEKIASDQKVAAPAYGLPAQELNSVIEKVRVTPTEPTVQPRIEVGQPGQPAIEVTPQLPPPVTVSPISVPVRPEPQVQQGQAPAPITTPSVPQNPTLNQTPSATTPPTRPVPSPLPPAPATPPVLSVPPAPAVPPTPPTPTVVAPASPVVNNTPSVVTPAPAPPSVPVVVTPPAVPAVIAPPVVTPPAAVANPVPQVPAATPPLDRSPVQPAPQTSGVGVSVGVSAGTSAGTSTGVGVNVQTGVSGGSRPLPITQPTN